MKPRTRSRWILLTLIVACIATGVWLSRIHTTTRATEKSLHALTAETQRRAHDIATLQQSLANAPTHPSSPTSLSPAEQIEHDRRALVPQLKQARLTTPAAPPRPPRNPSGPSGDHFPELMSDPEYARLSAQLQQHETRARWLHAFRYAAIPPEKQDQLRSLLHEFGHSGADADLTARRAGASEEQAWKARMQVHQEVAAEITALIGADAYTKIQQTQDARGAEEIVERIEARLSYSRTPLNASQTTQLFQLSVAQNIGFMVTDSTTFPALIEKARTFLNEDQLTALHAITSEFNGGKSQKIVVSPSPAR